MFRALVVGLWLLLLTIAALPPSAAAQTTPDLNPRLIIQAGVPGGSNVKFPRVDAERNTAAISGSNGSNALLWEKADAATTVPGPASLAGVGGNLVYLTTSVHLSSSGTLTYAWIDINNGAAIYLMQKPAGGSFGPLRTVAAPGSLRVYPEVTVAPNGVIFVVWNEDFRYRYTYSLNNGASWEPARVLTEINPAGAPDIATGPDNTVAVAFAAEDGNIYVGVWNGSGFSISPVTGSSGYKADPTIDIGGNGAIVVGFRIVEGGVYFAERQPNGTWPASKLVDGEAVGPVSVSLDSAGNLAITWIGKASGTNDIYYAFRSEGGPFVGPLRAQASGGFYDARAASNLGSGAVYTHIAVNTFSASGLEVSYLLFAAQGKGVMIAVPQVENGANIVGGGGNVSVRFIEVNGAPNQIRWRWGAPPTDAASDSSGWQTFTNPLSVPLVPSINGNDCLPETLYTQVRSGTVVQATASADAVIVDSGVSGSLRALNPALVGQAGAGANGGDPAYTRTPSFYLDIAGFEECAGLKNFQLGTSIATLGQPFSIVGNTFTNIVALPNPAPAQGTVPVSIRLRDTVDNVVDFTRVFTYDTARPVLISGTLTLSTPNPVASVLATLTFGDVNVTDNLYPGGYWGAWIANSREPVADPAASTALNWTALQVPGGGKTPVIRDWSLASGLPPDKLTPGVYYVYVRLLDGAGNPTDRAIPAQITLQSITLPAARMPVVVK